MNFPLHLLPGHGAPSGVINSVREGTQLPDDPVLFIVENPETRGKNRTGDSKYYIQVSVKR